MYSYSNKGVSKVISVLTIVTFLLTNTAYGAPNSRSFFKNKKVDYKKLSTQHEERLRDKKSVLQNEDAAKKEQHKRQAKRVLSSHLEDLSQIHIPSELGRVTDVYQAPGDDSRLVVHIQDLHTNPEAQLNLASILELLLKDYKLGLVCSEGADGEVDTSSVSSFPNYKAREKVAKIFINSGELTGEEYLSITKYPDLPIWGIEDRDIYFENIIEFNKIMKFSPQSQVFISQATKALDQLKPRAYSKELLVLDQKEAGYENEKIETDEYLKYLSSYIQRFNIPTSDYKNITLLTESMAQEKDIDQLKIIQESQNLLLNLQAALSSKRDRKSMDALVVKAQLFQEQKISPFSFYSYLKDLALKHIPEEIAKYPNLGEFIDYLINVNSLDATKLFVEMEALTYEVKQRIARTEEQKTLIKALRNIKFLEGFFNLKVSNEELDYYLENRESHKVGFFESFLKPALKKYKISLFIDYNPTLIDSHLQGLEDFYKTVKARDVAMVKNSVSEIEKRNVKVATLIAGGFHTKGITRMLKDKGYSYIVVSPYSSTDIDEENYHFLLSGRRKPITQLMEQLDLPEIVNRLTSGLRVGLGFDKDLKEAWNKYVVPEISKIWGVEKEELVSESIWERVGPVLALQKGSERWKKAIVEAKVIPNQKGNEVAVEFTSRYLPEKGPSGFQTSFYVGITPKSVRVLDEFPILKAKKLASISKEEELGGEPTIAIHDPDIKEPNLKKAEGTSLASNQGFSEKEIMDKLVEKLNESEKTRKIDSVDTLVLLGVFRRADHILILEPQYTNMTEEEVNELLSIINKMFEVGELVGLHFALADGMRELGKDVKVEKDDFLSERLYEKFKLGKTYTSTSLASNENFEALIAIHDKTSNKKRSPWDIKDERAAEIFIYSRPRGKITTAEERSLYYTSLLEKINDLTAKTGKSYRLVISPDMENLRPFIQGEPAEYYHVKGRNRREADFQEGKLSGTRKLYGVLGETKDKVFHLEYGKEGNKKSILTYYTTETGSSQMLINPKKTVLAYGFGTIASQVANALLRAGIEVIACNRSITPARKAAGIIGLDIVTTEDYVGQKGVKPEFERADFVVGDVEDLLKSGQVDAIIEGVDGKLATKDAAALNEKYNIQLPEGIKKFTNSLIVQHVLFNKHAPGVPIILQGGNDHKQADLVFESSTSSALGIDDFSMLFNEDATPKTVYHTSCNTTSLAQIMSILNVIEPYIDEIEVSDVYVNRRQGDRGKPKAGPAEARTSEIGYHWPTELLPLLENQEGKKLYNKIRKDSKESPDFTATAGMTEQTFYHIGRFNLRVKLTDGTYLTSKQFLRAALELKGRRIAIIQTDPKKEKSLDTLPVYDDILWRQNIVNPNISTISVSPLGTDNVEIKFLTFQESNVIPSELATLVGILGLTSSLDIANEFSNEVLKVNSVISRLEEKFPVSALEGVRNKSLHEVMTSNKIDLLRDGKASDAFIKEASITTDNIPERKKSVDLKRSGLNRSLASNERFEAKLGEKSIEGDRYHILSHNGKEVALLRINALEQTIKATSLIKDKHEYFVSMLAYLHRHSLDTGETIEFQDTDLNSFKAFVEGEELDYKEVLGCNRLEKFFAKDSGKTEITGTIRKYGYLGEDIQNRILHLDYGLGMDRTILTYHANAYGDDTFLVNPKKTVLAYGFGTIAFQTAAIAALRSGIEVVVCNRSIGPAKKAAEIFGLDVYTTKDYVGQNEENLEQFKDKETGKFMPFVIADVEQLLKTGRVDAIIEGVDGKLATKDITALNEKYDIELPEGIKKFTNSLIVQHALFKKKAPGVPIILQGGNDHKQGDLVFESSTWHALGYEDFGALFNEDGTIRDVYHTSCNTTTLAQITSVLSLLKDEIEEVEVSDAFITRRQGDRAKAKALAREQGKMDGDYHWNVELIPLLFEQVDPDKRIKFRMNANIKPDLTATAAMAGQTAYHFGMYNLRVRLTDGSYLTPQQFKEALLRLRNRRLALIQTKEKTKSVDGLSVFNHLLWDQDVYNPYISTAHVSNLGNDAIGVVFQTFQESNVIPSELATLFGLLRFTDSIDFANQKANEVLGVDRIIDRLEQPELGFPAQGVEYPRPKIREKIALSSRTLASNQNFEIINQLPEATKALADRDLNGKNVLVRVNLNEPSKGGKFGDTMRLDLTRRIGDFLLSKGATPIFIAHNGRGDKRQSLVDAAVYLNKRVFPRKVIFHKGSVAEKGLNIRKSNMVKGKINVIENVRFATDYEGMKWQSSGADFAYSIARLSDGIFIFDAFGDIGSSGASVEYLPYFADEVYVGPEMLEEFNVLQETMQGFDALILGGEKLDKVSLLKGLTRAINKGGFALMGSGPSPVLNGAEGKDLMEELQQSGTKIITARDYSDANRFDIGPDTLKEYIEELDTLQKGQTVIINGTMGFMEHKEGDRYTYKYVGGTESILDKLKELAARGVKIIVIGGHGRSTAKKYDLLGQEGVIDFSGGGVPLKILAGDTLKGLEAMQGAFASKEKMKVADLTYTRRNMPKETFTLKRYCDETDTPLFLAERTFEILEKLYLVNIERNNAGKIDEITPVLPRGRPGIVMEGFFAGYTHSIDMSLINSAVDAINERVGDIIQEWGEWDYDNKRWVDRRALHNMDSAGKPYTDEEFSKLMDFLYTVLNVTNYTPYTEEEISEMQNLAYKVNPSSRTLASNQNLEIDSRFAQWDKWGSKPVSMSDLNIDMFRDYDYRSVGFALKPETVFRFGLTWATMALEKAKKAGIENRKVLLARDARKVEPELIEALVAALRYKGLDVIYISADGPNAVTSYSWAAQEHKPLMSIFITASHVSRPKEEIVRGFKVAMLSKKDGNLESMSTREIKQNSKKIIKAIINSPEEIEDMESEEKGDFTPTNVDENCAKMCSLIGEIAFQGGSLYDLAREIEDSDSPVETLIEWENRFGQTNPLKGMKVVVEGSHTPSGKLAADTFKQLGADAVLINGDIQEVEGEHAADPSKEENLVEVKEAIVKENADFGIAFDLDGDRGAIIVPERSKTTTEINFHLIPPDNLIVALLPYYIEKLGYDSKTIGKQVGVIRDVLGTFGVNDQSTRLGIDSFQTDSGYVFLKAKRASLLEEGYIVPIYGERSGHTWQDVTGEFENPIAVTAVFAAMVKNRKYKTSTTASLNPFLEVFRENTIPYKQSTRFQPLFAGKFLSELSSHRANDTGWVYDANDQEKPPQAIIALGKDEAIKRLQKEFRVGKSYDTPAGKLDIREFDTYQDAADEGGFYRFADIVFELDGKFAGRFIFRASSNDPTFVCSFEVPLKEKEALDSEDLEDRYDSVGGVVLDWLENHDVALVTGGIEYANKKSTEEVVLRYREKMRKAKEGMDNSSTESLASNQNFRKIVTDLVKSDDTPFMKEISGFIEAYRQWIRTEDSMRLTMLASGIGNLSVKLDNYHDKITKILTKAFGGKLPRGVESALEDLRISINNAKERLGAYSDRRDGVDEAFNKMYRKNEAMGNVLMELAQSGASGSVLGLMDAMIARADEVGDLVKVEDFKVDGSKTVYRPYSDGTVRQEFRDAVKLGILEEMPERVTSDKTKGYVKQYKISIVLTNAQRQALPENIKEMLDRGKIKDEEVGVIQRALVKASLLPQLDNEGMREQMEGLYGKTFEETLSLGASKMAAAGFETQKDGSKVNRLGWTVENLKWLLGQPAKIQGVLQDAETIRGKYKYVIICGMGGSGLSVQTVKTTFGEKDIKIYSLRTTDPAVIKDILNNIAIEEGNSLELALRNTLIIAISKSGTTKETVSHKEYFEELYGLFVSKELDIKEHMWVITDKGSPMDTGDYEQREIQLNGKGDIGGRFTSPTTHIFLLPMALVAPERVEKILNVAKIMNDTKDINEDTFIELGAYLFHMASNLGKDKLTFMVPDELKDLPMWSEQLVEESLGKDGKGVSIFYGEDLSEASLKDAEENDRVFLRINIAGKKTNDKFWNYLEKNGYPVFEINVDDVDSIGGLMLGLQRSVATVGYLWDICFVDQPAVEGYKNATRAVMDALKEDETVEVPKDWKGVSFGKLTFYYDGLIKVGAVREQELNDEVARLGTTMDDAAAVYAAILNILKSKPGFEAKEIASYGRMTQAMKQTLEKARKNIFTDGLKMPSKLGEGPDKNHSYQQNIADGKDMWFSTYFMPLEVEQSRVLEYDDNLIKAQTIGTVNSIVENGRKVALITFDSTTKEAEGDLEDFFVKVDLYTAESPALASNQRIKIKGLEIMLGSLVGPSETIYVSEIKDGVILENVSEQKLKIEVKSHKGKQYAVIGDSVYLVKKGEIDLSKINPMGNDAWFDFFGLDQSEIDVGDCRVYLPVSEQDIVLFPANKVLYPSLLPDKVEDNLKITRRILGRYRDGGSFSNLQYVLHLAASVAMNGTPDDYYLAQDVLNRVQEMFEHKQYKEIIASVSDYLYLSYRGVDWNKWDKKITQLKTESKKKTAGEKKRTLTLYERDIEPTRLAVPDLENWEVVKVEALTEKDLSFISEDESDPAVSLGKQAIQRGEVVSVPFMGGSATTVKREIGQHKMIHKALKVRIKKARGVVTDWISIAQARLGLIFGQNENSRVVVVTSVDGTKEGESDRSIRGLLDTEYKEARNNRQIKISMQKAGLVLDTRTGEPLRFKDGYIATCAENHLWAFLSVLMDKDLVIDLLENSSGILSAGNGDNILNYPRASMVGKILKARKDGESIATVAMCSPSKGDKKGGFAARVTYRNRKTGEEITQVEFREVSEFATRKKGDPDKGIPGTGYGAIDLAGKEGTGIYRRLDKEKQFIEDIFGDRSVAFNVAFYAVDLRLFIARIFGFDEAESGLMTKLRGIDSQDWVDSIIELSEKVPETVQPEKKVPNEDNTDNVKGYMTEQAVQDFIVNSMGLLAKDGITPAVDIKLGDRKDTFLPYKGSKQSVLHEDGSEVMGDDGKAKEEYDLIANITVYQRTIESLEKKGQPLVLGEGAHVVEVLSTTKDEVIKVNKGHTLASGHRLGASDKQQLKIYVIPEGNLKKNSVPFNNWLDAQNKETTKVIIIARDRAGFDRQLVNYKNKYKATSKVLLKIIEEPGVDTSGIEEEFILRGVVPEDLTGAIAVFGKETLFGGFDLEVLNTVRGKALFEAIGEGV